MINGINNKRDLQQFQATVRESIYIYLNKHVSKESGNCSFCPTEELAEERNPSISRDFADCRFRVFPPHFPFSKI